MPSEPSASNQDPTLYSAYFGGPRDGLKTGDFPASFSGKKLTGMVSKTPLTQPHELSLYAVYECMSEAQVNGFWEFYYRGMEGPNGETVGAANVDAHCGDSSIPAAAGAEGPLATFKKAKAGKGDPIDVIRKGHVCSDVAEFNSLLLRWLDETTERTIGNRVDGSYLTVCIGGIQCRLSAETTRAGVRSYLSQVLSGDTIYSVVASSKGVVHRVAVGRTDERIQGFYLYTQDLFEKPQMFAAVGAAEFSVSSLTHLIFEAVAVLHARGHQRLRVFPNISGTGFWWRIAICSVEALAGHDWPFSMEPGAVFRYTTASGFQVGGLQVGPDTSADEVADAILDSLSDTGLGRDWAYAGWFVELLGLVRRHGCLPIGDETVDSDDGRRRWSFTKNGVMLDEPPLGQRIF